jgi:hypothetical protein
MEATRKICIFTGLPAGDAVDFGSGHKMPVSRAWLNHRGERPLDAEEMRLLELALEVDRASALIRQLRVGVAHRLEITRPSRKREREEASARGELDILEVGPGAMERAMRDRSGK